MFAWKHIYSPAETILELISDVLVWLPSVLLDNWTEGYLQSSVFLQFSCGHLYRLVQACTSSKSWKSASKTSYVQFSISLVSFRTTSYDKPTRRQIKKFKSQDNHIKHIYYTHGPPSSSSPALVVATCPCCHHPPVLSCLPSSSPPTLVIATHPCHRRPHCCHRLCSHLSLLPTLIVAARALHPCSSLLPAHAHRCCQRIASTLLEAHTCCCSCRALVVIVPAIVIAACTLVLVAAPTLLPFVAASHWLFRLVHNIMNKWT